MSSSKKKGNEKVFDHSEASITIELDKDRGRTGQAARRSPAGNEIRNILCSRRDGRSFRCVIRRSPIGWTSAPTRRLARWDVGQSTGVKTACSELDTSTNNHQVPIATPNLCSPGVQMRAVDRINQEKWHGLAKTAPDATARGATLEPTRFDSTAVISSSCGTAVADGCSGVEFRLLVLVRPLCT